MNKRQKEAQKRQEHKERILAAKARRRKGSSLERAEPQKSERPKILIVCEGKNTEPSYFSQFKLTNAEVFPVGEGKNTLTLVDSVPKLIEKLNQSFDQVWCVFDKDEFPNENFDNAVSKANSLGYRVAYSNQAFEFWLILHFEGHNGGAMHRDDYCGRLNRHLVNFDLVYNCDSKIISPEFFELMLSLTERSTKDRPQTLQDLAIERSIKIEAYHEGETPANAESSTLMHKLVEELNKYK